MNYNKKKYRIFNEDSKFLIYRPAQQIDNNDFGWYILMGLCIDERKKYLNSLNNDKIKEIIINNNIFYITWTTINEQNNKSFNNSSSILDFTLFPQEKKIMGFELLNC